MAEPFKNHLALEVSTRIHAGRPWEAAQQLADLSQLKVRFNSSTEPEKYEEVLQYYLHDLMAHGEMADAARILWKPEKFSPDPQSVKDLWNLYDTTSQGLVMGASSMGKSYSLGVRFMLEWVRDPVWTSIRVIGPSEDHLEQNLFSHLVDLHKCASLSMPGQVGDLFIGLDRRNQLSSIRGIVVPKGMNKKAGRLQGAHRRPRDVPHPIFGPLSRWFCFIDEAENVPQGIEHDINNVLSGLDKTSLQGFKVFMAYNPTQLTSWVAKLAEPPFGFENLQEDEHFRWKSQRGWDVLRLDGERSENVVKNEVVYPGLQTREGLEKIAANSGGRNSPGYMTMGRGMYPKMGVEVSVIPPGMLPKWRGEPIWLDDPVPISADDLALEGGDDAVRTLGKGGLATGVIFPPSLEFPNGRKMMFKDRNGNTTAVWVCVAEQQFAFPKGDTPKMKDQVIDLNKKSGTRPEFYACDRTGHGAGVADMVRHEWSAAIHDVNYSEGTSEGRIMLEDSKVCKDQYERMFTELWFALRMWGEFGYFFVSPKMDMSKLAPQLTGRRFRTATGGRTKVESKKDYQSRGFDSPNEADSLTLFVHAARKGSGMVPSMRGDGAEMPGDSMDDWPHDGYQGGARIDPSARTDYLDERMDTTESGMPIL